MSTTPVPRLVGVTWYPVPAPEGVPLTLGFPSEEACASFCEAVEPLLEDIEREVERRCDLFEQDHAADMQDKYDQGFDDGKEEGIDEGGDARALVLADECGAGNCEGYDVGWADGYGQAGEVARSAESA